MQLLVVIHEDRHIDTAVYIFETHEQAMACVDAISADYDPGDYDDDPVEGWIFSRTFNEEGDAVRIVARTLNAMPDVYTQVTAL